VTTGWWVEKGWMVALAFGLFLALLVNVIAYVYRRFFRARVAAALREANGARPLSTRKGDR